VNIAIVVAQHMVTAVNIAIAVASIWWQQWTSQLQWPAYGDSSEHRNCSGKHMETAVNIAIAVASIWKLVIRYLIFVNVFGMVAALQFLCISCRCIQSITVGFLRI